MWQWFGVSDWGGSDEFGWWVSGKDGGQQLGLNWEEMGERPTRAGRGLDVVRAGLVKLFSGTSLPPSQHCRVPVLGVRCALVALLSFLG